MQHSIVGCVANMFLLYYYIYTDYTILYYYYIILFYFILFYIILFHIILFYIIVCHFLPKVCFYLLLSSFQIPQKHIKQLFRAPPVRPMSCEQCSGICSSHGTCLSAAVLPVEAETPSWNEFAGMHLLWPGAMCLRLRLFGT